MQASKSREDLAHFDTFECLSCRTQIRETKPRPAPGDPNVPKAKRGRGSDDQNAGSARKIPIKNKR